MQLLKRKEEEKEAINKNMYEQIHKWLQWLVFFFCVPKAKFCGVGPIGPDSAVEGWSVQEAIIINMKHKTTKTSSFSVCIFPFWKLLGGQNMKLSNL